MLDTLGAVSARSDLQGLWQEVSPGLCGLLRCAGADLLGRPWTDVLHPDDAEGLPLNEQAWPAVSAEPLRQDRRFMTWGAQPRGWIWAFHATRLVLDEAGRPLYREHVLLDIDQRKRTELSLHDQAALLDSLSRHVPGMIYKLEAKPDGTPSLAFANDALQDMFELEPEAIQADFNLVLSRIHPDDLPMFEVLISTAMKTHEPTEFEFRVVLPRKGLRFLGGRAMSGRQSNGLMARFGYLHDITEHKLYQEATVQARAAEEASEAKSEFLSRMSHELRTPLNAILGFAQLLKLGDHDPLTDAQRGKVDVMEQAGKHLLAVINDVLDLSRIEAGRLPLSLEPVSVRSAFEHAVTLVGNLPQTSRVTLHPWGGEDLGVNADRVRLQQVLVNLLSNAIKYNRAGGLVELDAWADGDRVALQIADTGRGMTEEQLAHMFEPFNRLGAENTAVEGTGIGLVIVKRLVQLMHGDIEVHSAPGQGTRLICWLPASPLPEPKAVRIGHQDRSRRTLSGDHSSGNGDAPFTLLYVEDNEVNIDLVAEVLTMCPYCELSVARSGQEALERVRARRPDMMLLDMQLGDMTGFDVVRLLDREPETTGIPRVALSADAMPDTMRQAQAWGFRWYLTKPMDVMALVSVIDALSGEVGKRPPEMAQLTEPVDRY